VKDRRFGVVDHRFPPFLPFVVVLIEALQHKPSPQLGISGTNVPDVHFSANATTFANLCSSVPCQHGRIGQLSPTLIDKPSKGNEAIGDCFVGGFFTALFVELAKLELQRGQNGREHLNKHLVPVSANRLELRNMGNHGDLLIAKAALWAAELKRPPSSSYFSANVVAKK
jgi:hypothetical protein